jgi:DNA repair protein RecN (Recombination protein N)
MSLKSISLRNFVIVSELDLDLSNGFSVLTGETGAGKSILIDALQLVLGSRADANVIREGASRCEISVEFDCPEKVKIWLEQAGFEISDSLILRRTLDLQGRSRFWINGSPSPATQLKEVATHLIDIHGQHAWQSLTRPESVRGLLDSYARTKTETLAQCWQAWRGAEKQLEAARSTQDGIVQDRERLLWQIAEVEQLAPIKDEWQELNARHSRLSNVQSLQEAVHIATNALSDANENAAALIVSAVAALRAHIGIEPQFENPVNALEDALAQIEDATHTLNSYARHADLEPHDLEKINERLSKWISLARRYKRGPGELPELLESWQAELGKLNESADLEKLEKRLADTKTAYAVEAAIVTGARRKAAPLLAKSITQSMQGLGMVGGKFEVRLSTLQQPAEYGVEQAEFLVAGHSGSTPRPVGKVASGGELSRIALAIAVTTSQLGEAQTLIFDEVDAGIGGAVAESVGRLMKQLGRDRQVLAVTHLPQVAACADHHLLVAKLTENGQPASTVKHLDSDQRVIELARMLSGAKLSKVTLAHAQEMFRS